MKRGDTKTHESRYEMHSPPASENRSLPISGHFSQFACFRRDTAAFGEKYPNLDSLTNGEWWSKGTLAAASNENKNAKGKTKSAVSSGRVTARRWMKFKAWKGWCEAEGRQAVTTRQTFGRDLAAAVVGISRRRGTGMRPFYEGLSLRGGKAW